MSVIIPMSGPDQHRSVKASPRVQCGFSHAAALTHNNSSFCLHGDFGHCFRFWCHLVHRHFQFSLQHLGETHAQTHLYRDRRLFVEEIHGQ
jgi:hypothetical protein